MVARSTRERVAVALLAASIVVASVLGVMTVLAFAQGGTGTFAPAAGEVAGVQGANAGGSSSSYTAGGTGSSSQSQSGVSGGSITIGGFFDISGPVDSSVERDTVRAYMQGVNAAGGINGRQVQYVWCDSKYDASAAHSCAEYLISQHVLAVVGITAPLGENNEIGTLTGAGIPVIGGLGTPAEYANSLSFPVSATSTATHRDRGRSEGSRRQAPGRRRARRRAVGPPGGGQPPEPPGSRRRRLHRRRGGVGDTGELHRDGVQPTTCAPRSQWWRCAAELPVPAWGEADALTS